MILTFHISNKLKINRSVPSLSHSLEKLMSIHSRHAPLTCHTHTTLYTMYSVIQPFHNTWLSKAGVQRIKSSNILFWTSNKYQEQHNHYCRLKETCDTCHQWIKSGILSHYAEEHDISASYPSAELGKMQRPTRVVTWSIHTNLGTRQPTTQTLYPANHSHTKSLLLWYSR